MTEIKSWQDRFVGQYKTDDLPNLLLTYMLAEIAELRAALAESRPVEQGEPVEVQGRPAENFSFMVVDPKDADDLIKCGWEIRKLFTHPVRPMSDEQIAQWMPVGLLRTEEFVYQKGIKDAEKFHGIKGATE